MSLLLFKKFLKYAGLRAAVLAILGLLTLIFPELLQNGMIYIIAGYVILCGALGLADAVLGTKKPRTGVDYAGIALSCLIIVFGILTIGYYRYLVGFLPLFLGALLTAEGVTYFVAALCGRAKLRPLLIILALVIATGGMVAGIYSFGFGGLVGFSRIIGILLLVSCTYELILFLNRRRTAGQDANLYAN